MNCQPIRFDKSHCGAGLSRILEVSRLGDFGNESEAIIYLQSALHVSNRDHHAPGEKAVNIALSYSGSTHNLREYGPARDALYGLVHLARKLNAEQIRVWYDKIYCLGTDWDSRVTTGWIDHGVTPYLKYPVLILGPSAHQDMPNRIWLATEKHAAKLGVGYATPNGFWNVRCQAGAGLRTWNCELGAQFARLIMGNWLQFTFGRSDSEQERVNFKALMRRYASFGA